MNRLLRWSLLTLAIGALLFADGGRLILRKQAGPLRVTIFGSPEPLRVGAADISVLVEQTARGSTLLDSNVTLRLRHTSQDGIAEVFAPATHGNATNKLLYAARLNLPEAGVWKLSASIDDKSGSAEIAGTLNVMPPRPPLLAYWPYFAVVPVLIILFAWNQWLKRRRRSTNL